MKIPICVPSGGHLLLLLRKFVNISVDLMTRGPPFGITRAYEAGEEGLRCTISSMDQRKLKGNKSRGCSGVVPVATKFRHPFHSQPLFNPRVTAHVQMALRGRRGWMVSPNTARTGQGLNKIDFVQDRLLRLHIHSIYIFRWNILIARIMLKSVLKRQNIFVIYNVYSNWQSGIVRKYIEPRKKSGENLNWKCAVRQPCQQMTTGG